jgi:hypothetical protein
MESLKINNLGYSNSNIEKPVNFYEQTFSSGTRFDANFIIGGASVKTDEVIKVTYTETNYALLKAFDQDKLDKLRAIIEGTPGANLNDWSIIRGVVILDCTSSKYLKADAEAGVKASWISTDAGYHKQTENTNNFRLISIDLENMFLNPAQ